MSSIRVGHGPLADPVVPIIRAGDDEAQPVVAPDPLRRTPPAFVGR
jgi:hypothetical protein